MNTFFVSKSMILFTSAAWCLAAHAGAENINPPLALKQEPAELKPPAEGQGDVTFAPPEGWHMADSNSLPPSVEIMVVGQGSHDFPPSINLATEQYSGTLKQYLKIVKSINDAKGAEWKDLGTIRTEAGNASLSQVDSKTQWGDVRMMHVILLKNGTVYIMTAAALKDEFPKFYKDFFNSLRSLRINKNALEKSTEASSQ